MKRIQIFPVINFLILSFTALLCVVPFIHILALSFSSSISASQGLVKLWPVDFTTRSYSYVLKRTDFWRAMLVSIQRLAIGIPLSMVLTIMVAYPLSKETHAFKWRTAYSWFFFITMIFGGGMIPTYMVIKQTGLLDTIFALTIPGAVPVYHILILLSFFRTLPKELEEAALIDGAKQWKILWKIFVPLSIPALATLLIFTAVGHWNSWFDGIIYMNRPQNYPLQSFLRTVITMPDPTYLTSEEYMAMRDISDRTIRGAHIFIAALPIILVYPFLQRHFVKGMVLGSVKG